MTAVAEPVLPTSAEQLQLCLDREGEWLPGQPAHLKAQTSAGLAGRNVRILDAECNGAALLSGTSSPILGAKPVVGTGDAELYIKITYAGGGFEYVPAPVRAPREFHDVRELELTILCGIGHQACTAVRYRAFFNAHCRFERF